MRDMDKFRSAFAEFRALGYWARSNQEDGWAAVPEDVLRRLGKIIFWHANETSGAFDAHGNLRAALHMHHLIRDTQEVARVLKHHGLHVNVRTLKSTPVVVVHPGSAPADEYSPSEFRIERLLGEKYAILMPSAQSAPFMVILTVSDIDRDAKMLRITADHYMNTWATVPADVFLTAIERGILTKHE